jgi:small subunit ribosomal protein S21
VNKVRAAVNLDEMELEKGLKAFKSKLKKERVLEDLKRKRFHEKPSDIKRREKLKARRRYLRKLRKAQAAEMI